MRSGQAPLAVAPPRRPDFLAGGGAIGALMRAHPWSATPLGAPEGWPLPLRTLVGVMLGSSQPMFLAWGPERAVLYNDGYARLCGGKHPWALGRPFAEVWADILGEVGPIMDRAYAGESVHMDDIALVMRDRRGYPEEAHFAFSYTPVRDEAGQVAGVFCACDETTDKVFADRRLAFRLALGDRLRGATDPVAATMVAAEALGRHLGVARAGYGEIDAAQEVVSVARDWTDGTVASLAGEARVLDAFGPAVIAELRAGRTLLVEDCLTDPRSAGEAFAATWASIGCRALIVVPLVKAGRFRAILYLHEPRPRRWAAAEAALAEDVAERTWDAVERARAEAALRASEARLSRVLATAPVGILEADSAGTITFANPAAERMLGLRRPEIEGRRYDAPAWGLSTPDGEPIPPEDLPAARALRGETVQGYEHAVVDPASGSRVVLSVNSVPVRAGDGAVVGITSTLADVTAHKETEQALRNSEARLRTLVEANPIGTVLGDGGGRVLEANRAYLELIGHTRADLDADRVRWDEITPPEHLAADARAVAATRATGLPAMYEKEYLRADGRRVPVLVACAALPRSDQLAAFVVDLTERKAAEAAVRASEARFRAVLTGSPIFVYEMGPDLRYRWVCNPPPPLAPEQWVGRRDDETAPAELAAERMALKRQVLETGAGRRAEVRHQVGDAVHTYDLTLEPLRDADGRVVGLAGAALDITERKRAEARQRLLVAELSHRVKNMLATVQVIARRSLSSDRTLDEAREALAKRLRALAKAHDLLTASRWRGAGLRAVLAGELRPYGERAVLDGPELELAPNAAQTFALVLHELATNAAKHGALAAADGWLEVSWSRVTLPSRGDELRLVWRERDGLPVRAPSRRGFGRTLLEEGLRHELGGEVRLDFRPDGLVCELSVPAKAALSGS